MRPPPRTRSIGCQRGVCTFIISYMRHRRRGRVVAGAGCRCPGQDRGVGIQPVQRLVLERCGGGRWVGEALEGGGAWVWSGVIRCAATSHGRPRRDPAPDDESREDPGRSCHPTPSESSSGSRHGTRVLGNCRWFGVMYSMRHRRGCCAGAGAGGCGSSRGSRRAEVLGGREAPPPPPPTNRIKVQGCSAWTDAPTRHPPPT